MLHDTPNYSLRLPFTFMYAYHLVRLPHSGTLKQTNKEKRTTPICSSATSMTLTCYLPVLCCKLLHCLQCTYNKCCVKSMQHSMANLATVGLLGYIEICQSWHSHVCKMQVWPSLIILTCLVCLWHGLRHMFAQKGPQKETLAYRHWAPLYTYMYIGFYLEI